MPRARAKARAKAEQAAQKRKARAAAAAGESDEELADELDGEEEAVTGKKEAQKKVRAAADEPAAEGLDKEAVNTIWYGDDMVNALINQMHGDASCFKHRIINNRHVFVTPAVNDSDDANDTGIDYYLNWHNQAGSDGDDPFRTPGLFTQDPQQPIRILMPYCSKDHWQLCEINITQTVEKGSWLSSPKIKFSIDVTLHNPFGGGELDQEKVKRVVDAINQRLQEEVKGCEVEYESSKSTFKKRQHDGNACGVIVVDEIERRAQNQELNQDYTAEAVFKKRQEHLAKLKPDHRNAKLVSMYDGTVVKAFREAADLIDDGDAAKHTELVAQLKKLPSLDRKQDDDKVAVFYGSNKFKAVTVTEKGRGDQAEIEINVHGKGKYIVTVERVDLTTGRKVPGCLDVLHYEDGVCKKASTFGDEAAISNTRSRVQKELDKHMGVRVTEEHDADRAVPGGWAAGVDAERTRGGVPAR